MRVIAGKARRLLLKTVRGTKVRPTSDRTKETLFNILNGRLPGCRFLDLFSGSGAIGIEALSRGAGFSVFVENNQAAGDCILENLRTTRLFSEAKLYRQDVLSAICKLESEGMVFDLVFMDPPFDTEAERAVLLHLSASSLINMDTLLVIESSLATDLCYIDELGFETVRVKEYKTSKHTFIQKRSR